MHRPGLLLALLTACAPHRPRVHPVEPDSTAAAPVPAFPVLSNDQRHAIEQEIYSNNERITAAPLSPEAPGWQANIVSARGRMWQPAETGAAIDVLVSTYAPDSPWAVGNAANAEALARTSSLVERMVRAQAVNWHNTGKKLRSGPDASASFALAEHAYRTWFERFAGAPYATEMRYAFAELLYKLRKFGEAYDLYMQVVADDPLGPHAHFCAESAIFAADEMIKAEPKTGVTGRPALPPSPSSGPVPLTVWQQRELEAQDQFTRLYPTDPKTRNVYYRSAYLLYNTNHFPEAVTRFEAAIAIDPTSKEAEQAANLVLDSLMLAGDWVGLRDAAWAFLNQAGLGSAEFREDVQQIHENAMKKVNE